MVTELFNVMKEHFFGYNLRSDNVLALKIIQTMLYGIEIFSNLETKLWDLLPGEIENNSSLPVFKNKIRKWIPGKCPWK